MHIRAGILDEIERDYQVAQIACGGQRVWPYLRHSYYFSCVEKERDRKRDGGLLRWIKRFATVAWGLAYGWRGWFRKYDYIIFTDTSKLKEYRGIKVDKLAHIISELVGEDAVLFVESPNPGYSGLSDIAEKNVMSGSPLSIISFLYKLGGPRKPDVEGVEVLETIDRDFGLDVDHMTRIRDQHALHKAYLLFFRLFRPKAVFTTVYGFHIAKAARESGIKSIEIQHGFIGRMNPAYHSSIELDMDHFPDHLFVSGKNDVEALKGTTLYEQKNIRAVGSFYIEYMREYPGGDPVLTSMLSGFERSVGVTLQWGADGLVEFIVDAARLDPGILYLLIPRPLDEKDFSAYEFPENVIVWEGLDFYKTIKHVDFHTTVYSTCAVEAPSLGVQNILVDIGGLATHYFSSVLSDPSVTRITDTPRDYVDAIRDLPKMAAEEIVSRNGANFRTDYDRNIRKHLSEVLGEGCMR